MAQIKDLTKEQLWQLRQQIVLNSLFVNDYSNSFDIDPQECCTFFEGYMEELWQIATNELDYRGTDVLWVIEKCDNVDNLYNWWCDVVASI